MSTPIPRVETKKIKMRKPIMEEDMVKEQNAVYSNLFISVNRVKSL